MKSDEEEEDIPEEWGRYRCFVQHRSNNKT